MALQGKWREAVLIIWYTMQWPKKRYGDEEQAARVQEIVVNVRYKKPDLACLAIMPLNIAAMHNHPRSFQPMSHLVIIYNLKEGMIQNHFMSACLHRLVDADINGISTRCEWQAAH